MRACLILGLGLFLSASAAMAQSDQRFEALVRDVLPGGVLQLKDGRKVKLQGIDVPAAPVRPKDLEALLRAYILITLSADDEPRVFVEPDRGSQPGVDLVATVRTRLKGPSLNETLLRMGLAVFSCRTPSVAGMERLEAAAQLAQKKRRGLFGRSAKRGFEKIPYLNGAVLGLHHQDSKWDYHRQIDELHKAGFRHLCLLFSVFVDTVDAVEIRRDHKRTVRDPRLIETIRYAKKRGFTLTLLPICLILNPSDDDWRGVLRPKDESKFWQNYDRFLSHYADIAEHTGVDMLSIGSEFGSLEDRTATWQRLIRNVRGRYRGKLTYSVNWDHADTPRFFRELDVVGMTAYFSLTKKLDPSAQELDAQWERIGKQLAKTHAWHGRPVIFTELGYASQNGANRDPWNYVMAQDDIDLQEQVDCFAAFRRAAPKLKFLRGAFYYDYYDVGGKSDWSYSPRGKPAMAEWRAWASARK